MMTLVFVFCWTSRVGEPRTCTCAHIRKRSPVAGPDGAPQDTNSTCTIIPSAKYVYAQLHSIDIRTDVRTCSKFLLKRKTKSSGRLGHPPQPHHHIYSSSLRALLSPTTTFVNRSEEYKILCTSCIRVFDWRIDVG